jgi:hypothetical protein
MRALTVATGSAGYFPLLQTSARRFGFELDAIGWGKPWGGTATKLSWYRDALNQCDAAEVVMIVDGYDAVFTAPAIETMTLFKSLRLPYLFSGQRYFPSNPLLRRLADRIMGIDNNAFRLRLEAERYSRPCMGGLIGEAALISELFSKLIVIETRERSGHDQIPLNRYMQQHPEQAHVDHECRIFQSLWRTRGTFVMRGSIHPDDADSEVRVLESGTLENRFTGTHPQVLHAPMDLDMNPLLEAMNFDLEGIQRVSSSKYFRDSIRSYIKIFFRQQLAAVERWVRN